MAYALSRKTLIGNIACGCAEINCGPDLYGNSFVFDISGAESCGCVSESLLVGSVPGSWTFTYNDVAPPHVWNTINQGSAIVTFGGVACSDFSAEGWFSGNAFCAFDGRLGILIQFNFIDPNTGAQVGITIYEGYFTALGQSAENLNTCDLGAIYGNGNGSI